MLVPVILYLTVSSMFWFYLNHKLGDYIFLGNKVPRSVFAYTSSRPGSISHSVMFTHTHTKLYVHTYIHTYIHTYTCVPTHVLLNY